MHVRGCAAHKGGMTNVIPFKPRHKSAGTVRDGKKVGGQFDYATHSTSDVVLSAPADPAPSGSSGGPLRTIPETLHMAHLPQQANAVRNDLVYYADYQSRAVEDCYRTFSNSLEGDLPAEDSRRLFDEALGYAKNKDFESMQAVCDEAASYAGPRHNVVFGHLETAVLAAGIVFDEGGDDYARQSFMNHLEFLDRAEAAEKWENVREALATGGDVDKVCAEASARNAAAHPGGLLKNGYRPPVTTREPGYGQNIIVTGERYESGWTDATEIAANVRKELKAAQAGNYLPAGLTFSVTREKFSGGQAVRVSVRGLPDSDRKDPVEKDRWGDPADRAEVADLYQRVSAITNAWNRQETGSSYVGYYGTVDIEGDRMREFREREAITRKQRREQRASM